MSKPFANPFLETDMPKLFDMSTTSGNFSMPQFNMDAVNNLHRKNIATVPGEYISHNYFSV